MNKRQLSGRAGGLATLERHGSAHMKAVGSLGGRPKLKTLDELRGLSSGSKGGSAKQRFSPTSTH